MKPIIPTVQCKKDSLNCKGRMEQVAIFLPTGGGRPTSERSMGGLRLLFFLTNTGLP